MITQGTRSFPADETLAPERARALAAELGLTGAELDRVVATLGRLPTVSELAMYSVMWSEHCSYKSSKRHLRDLPTEGPHVLVGPGENAGVVDVGDGLAVTFKIESHNHPSFVAPYQGAATGVGGILRDILTMGARPVALMDSLRFGGPLAAPAGVPRPASEPDAESEGGDAAALDPVQRHLVDGVVRGVGAYGNCVGVPNIGGELAFDDAYASNPLVNVLAVGVLRRDHLQLAVAERPGDVAVLLGSATGRDGIGGASVLASQQLGGSADKRVNVQVGDPFAEKLLIECCLELYDRGLVSGIQDMGAAGIACSTAEMASKAGLGMRIDLDRVHLREPMASFEILCSESQERMLALVAPDCLPEVMTVAERWGVPASTIGEVVTGDRLELLRGGSCVADVPARSLADDGPVYDRLRRRPDRLDDYAAVDAERLELPADLDRLVLDLLATPGIATPHWVIEQYDSLVGSATVLGPGMGDAGVVRLPGSRRGVAVATDGNGRWCELDPREGTRRLVAEAFRNVACTGAVPLATTNCLNFGSPERPETMWQFVEAVAGLGAACAALGVPVTGGNVSFYNETDGRPILPTPVVGILGLLEDAAHAVGAAFGGEDEVVFLLGAPTAPGLAGSDLQRFLGRPLGGQLAPVDLELEAAVAQVLAEAARDGLLTSAHDVSSGGLVVTLAESALAGDVGVDITLDDRVLPVQALFSEAPGRVVVSVPPRRVRGLARLCADAGVPMRDVGTVGGDRLVVRDHVSLSLDDLRAAHNGALAARFDPPG